MKTISVDQVMLFHCKIIQSTGGSAGIREKDLIDSALNRGFIQD